MFRHPAVSLLCLLLLSTLSYTLINRFVVATVVVQGKSMAPTLADGDRRLLNRWSCLYRAPQRGELVVIRDPGHDDYAVKRIVALPGEAVELKGGAVFVDGRRLAEPYLPWGTQTFSHQAPGFGQTIVAAPDHYVVLGDNRAHSEDSRVYGAVHRRRIVGTIAE